MGTNILCTLTVNFVTSYKIFNLGIITYIVRDVFNLQANIPFFIMHFCKILLTKKFVFFSIWVFFHEHSRMAGLQGEGEGSSLTSHYHFHPIHRHLHISRALHIASHQPVSNWEPLVSERKPLITKLRALKKFSFE